MDSKLYIAKNSFVQNSEIKHTFRVNLWNSTGPELGETTVHAILLSDAFLVILFLIV